MIQQALEFPAAAAAVVVAGPFAAPNLLSVVVLSRLHHIQIALAEVVDYSANPIRREAAAAAAVLEAFQPLLVVAHPSLDPEVARCWIRAWPILPVAAEPFLLPARVPSERMKPCSCSRMNLGFRNQQVENRQMEPSLGKEQVPSTLLGCHPCFRSQDPFLPAILATPLPHLPKILAEVVYPKS